MNVKYHYETEKKKNKFIIYSIISGKRIVLYFQVDNEEVSNAKCFSSIYELDDLNLKFRKTKIFKNIEEFNDKLIENIKSKTLILQEPYRDAITSIWKISPKSKTQTQTFQLTSTIKHHKSISLIFFSNNKSTEKVKKEIEISFSIKSQNKIKEHFFNKYIYDHWLIDDIFIMEEKNQNVEAKIENCINLYTNVIEGKDKTDDYRTLLIFFDSDDLIKILKGLIIKIYKNQPFLIIFTNKKQEVMKSELENMLKELIEEEEDDEDDNNILPVFDLDNIFIFENNDVGYKKSILPVLKVFRYFNQLGDKFFKQLLDMSDNPIINNEIKSLSNSHYFNILLCGRTGVGKSSFINRIMGEKKAYTSKIKSAGTYRNNYYIHRKYPIKIIDVCGFADGTEAEDIKNKIAGIFNEQIENIIIDEQKDDIFTFYGDKRNNIHLFIYFNVYGEQYDILPGELPIAYEVRDHDIPIIFIVNKCPNKYFIKSGKKLNKIKEQAKEARADTDFENYETFFINCITRRGFGQLFQGIYDLFKESKIDDLTLQKIKDCSIEKKELDDLIENKKIFQGIEPKDIFLSESLTNSVKDIKNLVVRVAAYYQKELGFWKSVGFYWLAKIYNNIHRNSEKNFFPLLTNLVKKIYENFGFKKTDSECNTFIKQTIGKYFNIEYQNNRVQNNNNNNLPRPNTNSNPNNLLRPIPGNPHGVPGNLRPVPVNPHGVPGNPHGVPVNPHGVPINPHGVPINPHGVPINPHGVPINPHGAPVNPHGAPINPHGAPINPHGAPVNPHGAPINPRPVPPNPNTNPLPNPNPNTAPNPEPTVDSTNYTGNNSHYESRLFTLSKKNVKEEDTEKRKRKMTMKLLSPPQLSNESRNEQSTTDVGDDEDNSEEELIEEFSIERFKQDYMTLGKLFWNSEQNYQISENIESKYIKDGNKLSNEIFDISNLEIEPERLLLLVKRDFGIDRSKRESTSIEKILVKLFYISYTCNELISSLCGEINEKNVMFKSVYDFYYKISSIYNNGINGFLEIQKDFIGDSEKNI